MSLKKDPKQLVIEYILQYLHSLVPLSRARLATLGGNGIEAKQWLASGVKAENGWLIEKARKRNKTLIRSYKYHHHNHLETFSSVFQATEGPDAGLDFLHLDLCGTIEPQWAIMQTLLKLVLQSNASVLAITVADQRRNLALENFPEIFSSMENFTTPVIAKRFFARLQEEQTELPKQSWLPQYFIGRDPIKGAQKELSVAHLVLKALLGPLTKGHHVAEVKRFVYVSRAMGKRPFRMRTYVLRFKEADSLPERFVHAWFSQPIEVIGGTEHLTKPTQQQETHMEKNGKLEVDTERFPHFAKILQAVGAESQCYRELQLYITEREAAAVSHVLSTPPEVLSLIDQLYSITHTSQNGATENNTAQINSRTTAKNTPSAHLSDRDEFGVPADIGKETARVGFAVLRAKAITKTAQEYEALLKKLDKYYGLVSRANSKTHSFGARFAHVNGKFRKHFIKATCGHLPPDLKNARLNELLGYYNDLGYNLTFKDLFNLLK